MIADTTPTTDGTRSDGNSSRMMPNDSGNTAPPTPCSTRAPISTAMFGASAASRQPTASAISAIRSVRSLPCMSPIRPSSGVATETDRSNAVNTQVTVLGVVCRSC